MFSTRHEKFEYSKLIAKLKNVYILTASWLKKRWLVLDWATNCHPALYEIILRTVYKNNIIRSCWNIRFLVIGIVFLLMNIQDIIKLISGYNKLYTGYYNKNKHFIYKYSFKVAEETNFT